VPAALLSGTFARSTTGLRTQVRAFFVLCFRWRQGRRWRREACGSPCACRSAPSFRSSTQTAPLVGARRRRSPQRGWRRPCGAGGRSPDSPPRRQTSRNQLLRYSLTNGIPRSVTRNVRSPVYEAAMVLPRTGSIGGYTTPPPRFFSMRKAMTPLETCCLPSRTTSPWASRRQAVSRDRASIPYMPAAGGEMVAGTYRQRLTLTSGRSGLRPHRVDASARRVSRPPCRRRRQGERRDRVEFRT
jgi:hypothetical protein